MPTFLQMWYYLVNLQKQVVNKATVLALKARAALYAASPLFNTDNNPELWHRAATANKELLDYCVNERGMKLVSDYASLWDKNNYKNATDELIFGRRANRESSTMESYNYPVGIEGGNGEIVRHKIWLMRMKQLMVVLFVWLMEYGLQKEVVFLTRQNLMTTVTHV